MTGPNFKVLFNIPNTIGHIRIILLYCSILSNNFFFILFYIMSVSLDALDGKMARKYNQNTFLGSCLDMITDRASSIIIFMRIINNKPTYSTFLSITILTDILSHFLYFSFAISQSNHHKNPDNYFLKMYYKKNVLLTLCTASEMFFVTLYVSSIYKIWSFVIYFLGIISLVKTFFHFVQLYVALEGLSNHKEYTKKIN